MESSQPIAALPYILRALSLGDQCHSSKVIVESSLLLAELLLHFDLTDHAGALVDSLLPQISAHGTAKQRGQIYLLLAKIQLSTTPKSEPPPFSSPQFRSKEEDQ